MRCDVSTELKELRLHGTTQAWEELTTHPSHSEWLCEG